MSILLNDNLSVNAPKPTDSRFGPYNSLALALSGVVSANRYVGLTVGVITAGVVEEYWFNDGIADTDLVVKTVASSGGDFVDLTTDQTVAGEKTFIDVTTLRGLTVEDSAGANFGTITVKPDPNSSTGDVMDVASTAGVSVTGPFVVLDTTNLQITMPGAQLGSLVSVAAIDSFGVISLGYSAAPTPSYSVSDTNTTPVVVKAAGAAPPTAWVDLGLEVTLEQDAPAGTATLGFEAIFSNPTTRIGTLEFGLMVNGGAVLARDIVVQIAANFNQTVGMSLPLINGYVEGDVLTLMGRVTTNDNNAFSLTMANSPTDVAAMRFSMGGSTSGGGGGVNSVGAVAPLASSGGTDPQISMPAANSSQSGYLTAANFNIFNGKQAPATTLAGYGITDAYTKTQSDANYPTKAGGGATGTWSISITGAAPWANVSGKPTTIAGYGITDAYTEEQVDTLVGAKQDLLVNQVNIKSLNGESLLGAGNITIAGGTGGVAEAVDDLNSSAELKQWVGTQAQYDAIQTKDPEVFYNITDDVGVTADVGWDDISGKPLEFPPEAHSHPISEVDNLQSALNGKQATLVSGTNIKTINSTSLLGPGNIEINTQPVVSSSIYWNFNASVDADVDPGTGNLAIEDTGNDGRRVAFNKTDADGLGRDLAVLQPGDTLLFADDPVTPPSTAYVRFVVIQDPVDMGSWWKIDCILDGTITPTTPASGTRLRVTGYLDQGQALDWSDITNKPTTIAGYGITDAYTKTESNANYPSKTGGGASGNWGINITGYAASVDDLNSTAVLKQWVGTQAQYEALGTHDSTVFYNITDDEGIPGPQGPQGPQGVPGPAGQDGSGVTIKGTVTSAGQLPTSGQVNGDMYIAGADFTIPANGSQPLVSVVNGDGLTWSTNQWTNVGPIRGPQGEQGIQGPEGPKGDQGIKGDTGAQGIQGPQGVKGDTGDTGPAGPADWNAITNEPTTVAGYGITDAYKGIDNQRAGGSMIKAWQGTQAQYDAIVTKDPNTWYAVVG